MFAKEKEEKVKEAKQEVPKQPKEKYESIKGHEKKLEAYCLGLFKKYQAKNIDSEEKAELLLCLKHKKSKLNLSTAEFKVYKELAPA